MLLYDFLADVKDWMFHNLLQLNLDKTGIIQGEEKLEWLQSVLCFAACTPPPLPPPSSLTLSLLISLFLSFTPLHSLSLFFCLLLYLTDKALVAHFWSESPWGKQSFVCIQEHLHRIILCTYRFVHVQLFINIDIYRERDTYKDAWGIPFHTLKP